jgi:hypothetical protein
MEKGDIIFGRKNSDAVHPIVYLKDSVGGFFIGAMLTTSKNFADNILMAAEHFKTNDEKGVKYELQFNNTHLVKAKLLKRNEWQPFRKIGELSDEGIEFVESKVSQEHEKLWEDYISGH